MVLTKRQRVMVVVLGLGVAALAADRLTADGSQTGPSQAQAASPGIAGPGGPGPASIGSTELLANPLAAKLDTLRETMDLDLSATKDAFCPSESWLSDLRPEERVATSSVEVKVMDFGRRHQLNAIVTSDGGGGVFIDDKFVRMGQVFDGFRLVKLGYRTAVFENNDVKAVLTLKDQHQEQ